MVRVPITLGAGESLLESSTIKNRPRGAGLGMETRSLRPLKTESCAISALPDAINLRKAHPSGRVRVDRPRSGSRAVKTRFELHRKEVIQPQVLLQLPCYDFTPITPHTLDARISYESAKTFLGTNSSHGVTGGVYKARERIHRVVADTRLLAISTSWSRVADSNPNLDRLY